MRICTRTAVLVLALVSTVFGSSAMRPYELSLRTNALFTAALMPNVGVEFRTAKWGFMGDYVGCWWNDWNRGRFYSDYGWQVQARRYFGPHEGLEAPWQHHAGLYAQAVTFDFKRGAVGYQCARPFRTWAIGAAYGWKKRLGKDWHMDLSLGIGYVSSGYDKYIRSAGDGRYYRIGSRRVRWFGITLAEVSFSWTFAHRPRQSKVLPMEL